MCMNFFWCFKDKENSKIDSIYLLTITVEKWQKISKENLNVFLGKVYYLKHDLSQEDRSLIPD